MGRSDFFERVIVQKGIGADDVESIPRYAIYPRERRGNIFPRRKPAIWMALGTSKSMAVEASATDFQFRPPSLICHSVTSARAALPRLNTRTGRQIKWRSRIIFCLGAGLRPVNFAKSHHPKRRGCPPPTTMDHCKRDNRFGRYAAFGLPLGAVLCLGLLSFDSDIYGHMLGCAGACGELVCCSSSGRGGFALPGASRWWDCALPRPTTYKR